jgi:hypothetical protein
MTLTEYAGARVVRVAHRGELYHPVVARSGRLVDPPQLHAWAHATDLRPHGRRRLLVVLADESEPVSDHPRVRISGLRYPAAGLPLLFLDSGLVVGMLEHLQRLPPGTTPGTMGAHLLAVATLHDTLLADLAWRALREGLFGGVCIVVDEPEDAGGVCIGGQITHVVLGDVESNCLPSARVLATWEDPS